MKKHFNLSSHQTCFLWSIFFVLAGFALSSSYVTSTDTRWLAHEAQLFFSGGHYGIDFIDTNSPGVFFLYQPINWLKKLLPFLSFSTVASLYVYLLITLSVCRCHSLLSKESELPAFIGPLIALLFALLPMMEQGQRDCLMLVFSMPYLLDSASKKPKNSYISTFFAALGFLLRPLYFILPISIELYLYCRGQGQRKNILIFVGTFIAYLLYMMFGTPDYWQNAIPLAKHYYFHSYGVIPFKQFITEKPIFPFISGLICCFIIICRKKLPFLIPFLIALSISSIVYITLQQAYLYHLIPIITYWAILTGFLLHYHVSSPKKSPLISTHNILLLLNVILLLATIAYHVVSCFTVNKHYLKYSPPAEVKANSQRILPLLYYAPKTILETLQQNKIDCSRSEGLWMLTRFLDQTKKITLSKQDKLLKAKVQRWVVEDIKRCDPDVIIFNSPVKSAIVDRKSTLSFFLDNPNFRALAPKYRFLRQVGNLLYYVRRNSDPQATHQQKNP